MSKMRLSSLEPYLLSLLRAVAAFTFAAHGAQKLFGWLGGTRVPVFSLLGVAGLLEFLGGILLLVGLYTRPVAFVLSGQMAFAYFMAHAPHGFWPALNKGELAVVYCFLFLYLSAAGAGPLSLDSAVRREEVVSGVRRCGPHGTAAFLNRLTHRQGRLLDIAITEPGRQKSERQVERQRLHQRDAHLDRVMGKEELLPEVEAIGKPPHPAQRRGIENPARERGWIPNRGQRQKSPSGWRCRQHRPEESRSGRPRWRRLRAVQRQCPLPSRRVRAHADPPTRRLRRIPRADRPDDSRFAQARPRSSG